MKLKQYLRNLKFMYRYGHVMGRIDLIEQMIRRIDRFPGAHSEALNAVFSGMHLERGELQRRLKDLKVDLEGFGYHHGFLDPLGPELTDDEIEAYLRAKNGRLI